MYLGLDDKVEGYLAYQPWNCHHILDSQLPLAEMPQAMGQ